MDAAEEQIDDYSELDQVRKQAGKIHLQAFMSALIITIFMFIMPEEPM